MMLTKTVFENDRVYADTNIFFLHISIENNPLSDTNLFYTWLLFHIKQFSNITVIYR